MFSVQLLWSFLVFIYPVYAAIRNITIDDTFGDGFGNIPNYKPSNAWEGPNCVGCLIQPDRLIAHEGTWNQATYSPDIDELSMSFDFKGTDVYLFFILANTVRFATTETLCNFTIDGTVESTFRHIPTISTDLEYGAAVFHKSGLSQDNNHTVTAVVSNQPSSYWMAFDFAVVTYDDSPPPPPPTTTADTPSSSPESPNSSNSSNASASGVNVGAIAGGIVGGVVLIAVLIFLLFWRRLQKRKVPSVVNLMEEVPMIQQDRPFVADSTFNGSSPSSRVAQSSTNDSSSLAYSNVAGTSRAHTSRGSDDTGVTSPTSHLSSLPASTLARRESLRDARQRELENEVGQLRSRLKNVQDAPSSRALAKIREADEAEKHNLRSQVSAMENRLQQLEVAQQSPWAQGDSDEPPPGYAPVDTH